MKGVVELDTILNTLSPKLQDVEFVFCSVPGPISAYGHLEPLAVIREPEGLTLILPVMAAVREKFRFDHTFRQITLTCVRQSWVHEIPRHLSIKGYSNPKKWRSAHKIRGF